MKNNHTIKAVLFDFDGVVVRSMEHHFQAWQRAFAVFGINIDPAEFYPLEGQGINQISRQLGEPKGLSSARISEVQNLKNQFFDESFQFEVYPGFTGLIRFLKTRYIPMAVVTGGGRNRVQATIEKYLPGVFDTLVTVDDVARGKPFPDPFLKAAENLGIEPARCLVIENAPLGIRGALAAGMEVIALTSTLPAEFLKQAGHIVSGFEQIQELLIHKI